VARPRDAPPAPELTIDRTRSAAPSQIRNPLPVLPEAAQSATTGNGGAGRDAADAPSVFQPGQSSRAALSQVSVVRPAPSAASPAAGAALDVARASGTPERASAAEEWEQLESVAGGGGEGRAFTAPATVVPVSLPHDVPGPTADSIPSGGDSVAG